MEYGDINVNTIKKIDELGTTIKELLAEMDKKASEFNNKSNVSEDPSVAESYDKWVKSINSYVNSNPIPYGKCRSVINKEFAEIYYSDGISEAIISKSEFGPLNCKSYEVSNDGYHCLTKKFLYKIDPLRPFHSCNVKDVSFGFAHKVGCIVVPVNYNYINSSVELEKFLYVMSSGYGAIVDQSMTRFSMLNGFSKGMPGIMYMTNAQSVGLSVNAANFLALVGLTMFGTTAYEI